MNTIFNSDEIYKNNNLFEKIKHINKNDNTEYWFARELQSVLQYSEWRSFFRVIKKSQETCKTSEINPSDHFVDVNKMVAIGSGASRETTDFVLTRYACYLIMLNADPAKEIVAMGKTYFAIQTRRQEISDEFDEINEDRLRIAVREELKRHNSLLADAAHDAGVLNKKDYAIFQNEGYKGLYGGLGVKDIHHRKGLNDTQKILDHMGSTELAANLFRATQADDKLRRENIKRKELANKTHHDVGATVRKTIRELGGIMPEDLPTPEKSIKQLQAISAKALADDATQNNNK